MIKRVLAVGMVQLVLCLALATGAETQSNKAVEFIKLSSEAENYFLNEDYERVKTAVEKMDSILERQTKLTQRGESFSPLSTPENGREKMLVQKGSTRCENHCSNGSFRYYDQLCSFWATDFRDAFVVTHIPRYGKIEPTIFAPANVQRLERLIRRRRFLTDTVTQAKNKTSCMLDEVSTL